MLFRLSMHIILFILTSYNFISHYLDMIFSIIPFRQFLLGFNFILIIRILYFVQSDLPSNMRFGKGEYIYASAQQHFGIKNATTNEALFQMLVWRCKFGNMTTQLRTMGPEEGHKLEIANELNWTKVHNIEYSIF